jgi:hypothetical protein
MSLPFDATLKDIVQSHPHDYETELRLSGPQPVTVLNVDLSTLSAATDIVLAHGDPPSLIDDINFQSGPDPDLSDRVLLYNAVLRYRYQVPVHSVVILLRPAADHPNVRGRIRYAGRRRRGKMDFSFEMVRLWRRPVKRLLKGGLGTLPLATLCRLPEGVPLEEAMAGVVRQIEERLRQEAPEPEVKKLLTAAFTLTGLRVSREVAQSIFQGVQGMRESTTYQFILDEGRIEEAQKILLRQGRQRFGLASDAVKTTLLGTTDLERLERMADRLLQVSSWQELLETP